MLHLYEFQFKLLLQHDVWISLTSVTVIWYIHCSSKMKCENTDVILHYLYHVLVLATVPLASN
jgi:hypothetical protein